MLVEGVEEGEAKLEVGSLPYPGVLGDREVQVLPTRTSQVCNARTVAGVSISSGTTGRRAGYAEVPQRLERCDIQERSGAGIVSVRIMQEGIGALDRAD